MVGSAGGAWQRMRRKARKPHLSLPISTGSGFRTGLTVWGFGDNLLLGRVSIGTYYRCARDPSKTWVRVVRRKP